ncbi:Uncharacterized protein APZ42_031755 [Daphnia magna]|uniref:Uncharacterized protein n=1 Tax=Daphnia magna TaxID=35525 RepID=A0A164MLT7_9CRUS|nr:Uncharacterized protein APZ42_031755 [Daphnia magna]
MFCDSISEVSLSGEVLRKLVSRTSSLSTCVASFDFASDSDFAFSLVLKSKRSSKFKPNGDSKGLGL